jgi:hypothetical protein
LASNSLSGKNAAINTHHGDDFKFQSTGAANLRIGRHNIWVDAPVIEVSETNVGERSFTFGTLSVGVRREVKTTFELERYDIRYGYSLFDFDKDGFRLGPTISLGLLDFKVALTDKVSSETDTLEDKFPVPRIGVHGEVTFGNFLVEADIAGLYIDYDDYEGYAVDANFAIVWRPYKYFGLVGGYRLFAVDIDDSKNNYEAATTQ